MAARHPHQAQANSNKLKSNSSTGRKGNGKGSQHGAPPGSTASNPSRKAESLPSGPSPVRRGWGVAPHSTSSGIARLVAMGFHEEQAREALVESAWDVNKALDSLLIGASSPPSGADTRAKAAEDVGKAKEKDEEVAGLAAAKPPKSSSSMTTASDDASDVSDMTSGSSPRKLVKRTPRQASHRVALHRRACIDVAGDDASDVSDVTSDSSRTKQEEACKQQHDIAENSLAQAPRVAPRKERLRVSEDWSAECSQHQLSLMRGSFVLAWMHTQTGNGWMYAELDSGDAGWVPSCVIERVPANRRWMRALQPHTPLCDKQLALQEGDVSYVHVDTRTEAGWVFVEVFVEAIASKPALRPEEQNLSSVQSGWVPDFCFEECLCA